MKMFNVYDVDLTPECVGSKVFEVDGCLINEIKIYRFSIEQQLFLAYLVMRFFKLKNALAFSYAIRDFIKYCLDNDVKNFNNKYLIEKYGKVGNFMVRWYLFHAKRIKKMYIENTIITK